MDIEPTDMGVAPDTDDLDAFTSLLNGRATVKEPIPTDPVVEDEPDEAPEDVVDTPDGEEDKPKEEPKKVNRVQERINQLLERERVALERAETAERKLDERPGGEPAKETPTPVVRYDGPSPDETLADGTDKYPLGEFDPTYIRDMARHTIDTEWNLRKEQEARETSQRQEQTIRDGLQKEWVTKVETVQDVHEDFVEKTLGLEATFEGLDPQYSDYLVQTIKSLDHGPEVLYYFANNLEEAQKFVRMGPNAATLALGEYNAMFRGSKNKEAKVSKAPPPPQVNKGSTSRTSVAADTDDLDAFAKLLFKKK